MSKAELRVGIAGAGWWATENYLPILMEHDRARAVAVNRHGRAELLEAQRRFCAEIATEDFDEMIASGHLDALFVSSPHNLHYQQARKGLEAGLHVLVEKPMTTDTAQARELVALARREQRNLMVPYGWNFRPFTEKARDMIEAGRIGRIRHVAAHMASPAGDLFTGRDFAGTEDAIFRPIPDNWANAEFGGYGWGQLVHLLGLLFYLTDLEPAELFAFTGKSDAGADIYDAVSMRFSDGETATLSGAATVPHGSPFQIDIRIFGDAGMLLFDMERERVSLRRDDGEDVDLALEQGDGAYQCAEPVRRFIAMCLGEPAGNNGTGETGLKSVAVVEAMLRSAASGTKARIDL